VPSCTRSVRAASAPSQERVDHGPKQCGLAAEDPIDGLHHHAGLGSDVGHRHPIASLAEQPSGGRQDLQTRLLGLFLPPPRLVPAAGLDVHRHFVSA